MNARNEPGVRRLLARQRLCRMAMRRQGLLALSGYTPPPGDDVQRIWRSHGWEPSGRVLITITESRRAA